MQKILSLNIERTKHLDVVLSFLEKGQPDIVCLQEVMESSVPSIIEKTGLHGTFVPMAKLDDWEEEVSGDILGIAILTKGEHDTLGVHYYHGENTIRSVRREMSPEEVHEHMSRVLLTVRIQTPKGVLTVGTTHFPDTEKGSVDEQQRKSLKTLLSHLSVYENIVLCGDFNIPRGNSLYKKLCEHFTDNVPREYTTSIDQKLHRVRGLQYMVDYMWSKGNHVLSDVRLQCGVSDHCAVLGSVDIKK